MPFSNSKNQYQFIIIIIIIKPCMHDKGHDKGHLLEVIHVLEDQDISRIILNKIKMPIRKPKLGPSFI